MSIQESYPNCPKYIQQRQIAKVSPNANAATTLRAGMWLNMLSLFYIWACIIVSLYYYRICSAPIMRTSEMHVYMFWT